MKLWVSQSINTFLMRSECYHYEKHICRPYVAKWFLANEVCVKKKCYFGVTRWLTSFPNTWRSRSNCFWCRQNFWQSFWLFGFGYSLFWVSEIFYPEVNWFNIRLWSTFLHLLNMWFHSDIALMRQIGSFAAQNSYWFETQNFSSSILQAKFGSSTEYWNSQCEVGMTDCFLTTNWNYFASLLHQVTT